MYLIQSAHAKGINAILDAQFEGRRFQVVSIADGEALSGSMSFSAAYDELESIAYGAGGVSNGMEIREVL